MKTLVIGMDGAQLGTFQRGWTPFIQSLIEERGTPLDLKEDLISRGWAEIITGEHALTTGAMYERPLMGGTHRWTDKLCLADIEVMNLNVKPIWKALNEKGYRVGIMNVPTTFPAPQVDGFFVSGGGGGGGLSQRVTPEQCHPKRLSAMLNDQNYILDERLPSLLGEKQLFEPKEFFDRLDEVNTRRTASFINLVQKEAVDFGFVVYRSSIVTTETLLLPELQRQAEGHEANQKFIEQAHRLYTRFDNHIRQLVETFPAAQVVLVSDHAMAPRKWSVNFNAFLVEQGFQQASSSRRGLFDAVKSVRHLIPRAIRQRLKSSAAIKSAYQSLITFDPKHSQAFNITFTNATHGFYVNDHERFGGPVPSHQVTSIQNQLVETLNRHPVAREHGFKATAKTAKGTVPADQFPDVVVEMPDGYAPSNGSPGFVTEYTVGREPIDLRVMGKDRRVSAKAHHPLAVVVNASWQIAPNPDKADLRLVYDQIMASFED
ncbi:alkaline phosphatase family protein [Desulfobulbus alkaliphilus]|uniref:alkaline phosphatase family protein n=1 Tax=Desulfobulbus alkaliphilus TaxID=869814 RepID=UPI0019669D6D|nr:alkaline phosphatase family protein [Desulfobulbus alkaliphilus]MBM9538607.1 alkaline phosphatase family protein [Desulfobulbus alkaliphilus]